MATLQEVLDLARQLSLVEKRQLIEQMTPEIQQEVNVVQHSPRKSLWGICSDLGEAPSASDIEQVRHEMWADFPRGDI